MTTCTACYSAQVAISQGSLPTCVHFRKSAFAAHLRQRLGRGLREVHNWDKWEEEEKGKGKTERRRFHFFATPGRPFYRRFHIGQLGRGVRLYFCSYNQE